jgi:hypothetical protein
MKSSLAFICVRVEFTGDVFLDFFFAIIADNGVRSHVLHVCYELQAIDHLRTLHCNLQKCLHPVTSIMLITQDNVQSKHK